VGLTDEDVREILRIIDESQLDELRIEMPGFSLHVRRGGAPPPAPETAPAATAPAAAPAVSEAGASEPAASPPAPAPAAAADTPTAGAGAAAGDGASADGRATISAPMLGTFYRASAPGEQPFVDVGSQVDPDTVVCLIEVMKMMNSVKAGVAGTVVEVCAENAQLVEFGEPLFRVDPAA
jgi:acetyl-CoA carboxylase biotin carboxyl carrier protein